MPGGADVSLGPACDALSDKPVDCIEPTIADRIALEKRFVLGVREFDQGAVRQKPSRLMVCRRIDESLYPRAGEQDRCADLAEKLGPTDPPHEAKRRVEPGIGRLIDTQLGARRKPAILQAATLGIARGAAD